MHFPIPIRFPIRLAWHTLRQNARFRWIGSFRPRKGPRQPSSRQNVYIGMEFNSNTFPNTFLRGRDAGRAPGGFGDQNDGSGVLGTRMLAQRGGRMMVLGPRTNGGPEPWSGGPEPWFNGLKRGGGLEGKSGPMPLRSWTSFRKNGMNGELF